MLSVMFSWSSFNHSGYFHLRKVDDAAAFNNFSPWGKWFFVDNQDWHFYGFAAEIILLALKTFTCLTISYFVKGVSFSSYVKTVWNGIFYHFMYFVWTMVTIALVLLTFMIKNQTNKHNFFLCELIRSR